MPELSIISDTEQRDCAMDLRDYQDDIIKKLRAAREDGKKSLLVVSPCGSGKTVIFAFLAGRLAESKKSVLILAHRIELIEQISSALGSFNVLHGAIAAGAPSEPGFMVQVGMVGTVARRLDKITKPDFIIIDEAHHSSAQTWKNIFAKYPDAIKIGVTATPTRLSGESLGDIFDHMVLGPEMESLIAQGYLSKYKIFAQPSIDTSQISKVYGEFNQAQLTEKIDGSTIFGDAVREYGKRAIGKRAIVFCTSIKHAEKVAELFREAGHVSASIDGKMDKILRKNTVERFRRGEIKILTSCDIISEGFDLPAIECAIMLRPTASLALWIQQSGRALRIFEDKDTAIILDHAGNTERHGFPDEKRDWSLTTKKKNKSRNEPLVRMKTCKECFAAMHPAATACPYCGAVAPIKQRTKQEIDGDLVEAVKRKIPRNEAACFTFEDCRLLCRSRGYKQYAEKYMWQRVQDRLAGIKSAPRLIVQGPWKNQK